MTALLEVADLTIAFGNAPPVVDGVSFALGRGRTLGLVGESGSGKSLTALSLLGLLPDAARLAPRSRIVFDGAEITGLSERGLRRVRGRRIGIVFQDPMACLNPFMAVGRQIAEVARTHLRVTAAEARERARTLLEEVGIPEPARRLASYPHELSGGQQQRVMLAVALAADPDLLVADEPTTALDATIQAQILELLQQLQARRGMAMLFVSHDLGVVAHVADEVAVMRGGQLLDRGPTRDVLVAPRHAYTRTLVDARCDLASHEPAPSEHEPSVPPAADVEALRIAYRQRLSVKGSFVAVDDVGFRIERGRTLGLVGESGSGKSSVARALVGLVRPSGGDARILGVSLATHGWRTPRSLRGRRQIVFQNPYGALNPRLRVERLLHEALGPAHRSVVTPRARMTEVLEEVGLSAAHLARYPHELSGGQRQRVCIARALLSDPEFLICDEVVSSLDVTTQAQVVDLLRRLQVERGFAMLFIGHDLDVVAALSHEIAVMRAGRIVERGETTSVLANPTEPYTTALVAAMRATGIPASMRSSRNARVARYATVPA